VEGSQGAEQAAQRDKISIKFNSRLTFTATKWGDQSRNEYDIWLQTNVQQPENQRFCFIGSDYCVKLLRYVSLKSPLLTKSPLIAIEKSSTDN